MHKDILDQLYKPFTLKSRPGQGGQTFQYVEIEDIVDRMNRVFHGNWTSEVIMEKEVEGFVLMRVRVGVRDPNGGEDERFYYQEGYASQPIAKFTFGDKKGQVIDIGNSYKSAMSKAIKTAVSRWGVGLYLEGVTSDELLPDAPFNDAPPAKVETKVAVKAPVQDDDFFAPPDIIVPVEPKKDTAPPKVQSAPVTNAPFDFEAPFQNNDVVVKPAPKNSAVTPLLPTEEATDIQKVAIETILAVHNIKFADLAAKSLGRVNNLPTSTDGLSYSDAVCMIKVGNNLKN